ncbi:MAG: hypothetical protein LBG52_00305 [Candidatus Peribacteria bacterium]|nr:hypothetical protein [Candidatus Peribacteria bacterium]
MVGQDMEIVVKPLQPLVIGQSVVQHVAEEQKQGHVQRSLERKLGQESWNVKSQKAQQRQP